MSRVLLGVDDEHGHAEVIIDVELSEKERQALGRALPADLSEAAAWALLAALTRQVADEQAYDRVREQRGLLW